MQQCKISGIEDSALLITKIYTNLKYPV